VAPRRAATIEVNVTPQRSMPHCLNVSLNVVLECLIFMFTGLEHQIPNLVQKPRFRL
jgi:hypothetical protein